DQGFPRVVGKLLYGPKDHWQNSVAAVQQGNQNGRFLLLIFSSGNTRIQINGEIGDENTTQHNHNM
ncbi:hypothetical protein, partial [Zoogloea oleivorans]|uniref:hypothetical protein n=1 Tax=Zoogloea oleivorans TaxID=1552750 RepID=UPI001CA3129F